MVITYTQIGDYLLPNLKLLEPPGAPPLGRYGQMRKVFLNEHRPIFYSRLQLSEQLYPHCREIDEAAATRLATIQNRELANEIILDELVYN